MSTRICQFICAALLSLAVQAHTAAASEKWLTCSGTVSKSDEAGITTDASHRVLAYSDDKKMLFQWGEQQKTLTPVSIVEYTPKQIIWGNMSSGAQPKWEGKLDRSNMSLKMERIMGHEKHQWSERCSPTQSLDGSASPH